MADLDWKMIEGEDAASVAPETLYDRNYRHTVVGREPGQGLLQMSTLGWNIDIPVEVTAD
jgi:hypothetical protein